MSLTTGQKEYLLELLSHEYVLTEEQQPVVRQAICQYATTVYDQQELNFLLSMPQSLAACLYYSGGRQTFSRQYALWLNCLEHSIYQDMTGLEAVLLNPDPTSSAKLLAILRQNDTLTVITLPQLRFAGQQTASGCSRWSLQEARDSFYQFLQYAHAGVNCAEAGEPLTWCDLLQQARLFPLVKETYTFAGRADGLAKPSGWAQLQALSNAQKQKQKQQSSQRSWMYQPPANPFATELKLMQQMKQSLASLQSKQALHLPEFPAPPRIPFGNLPPFPFAGKKRRP